MFLYSVSAYISALLINFTYLHNNYKHTFGAFYLSLIIFILLIIFCRILKNSAYVHFIILITFFSLGFVVVSFNIANNKTVLLKHPIVFAFMYGEIYKLEKTVFENKSYVYLKNLVPSRETEVEMPSTVKVVYQYPIDLKTGDIVKGIFTIYPPSQKLLPYGFDFSRNAFFNNIGSNGYVLGKLQILENIANIDPNTSNLKFSLTYLTRLKHYLSIQIKTHTSEESAPFLAAVLLGEQNFLPKENLENLRKSSLSHLISISGYHISLIALFMFFIIRNLLSLIPRISIHFDNKKITSILTIGFLLFYLLLIGFKTPALRAVIMSTGFLLAIILNFRALSLNSLFLAGLLILIWKPYSIYSASFLLSFYATLTIILFWKNSYIQKLYRFKPKSIFYRFLLIILFSIILTFIIEISITPIIVFYFGNIPLVGIIANTLVSPIFSFIIMPSLLIYFLTPVIIGKYFLIIADYGMKILLEIANFFGNLSFSNIWLDFFPSYLLGIFLVAYLLFAISKGKVKYIWLTFMALTFAFYPFNVKYPDIILDYEGRLVAFKKENYFPSIQEGTNEYIFSKAQEEKFIKSNWFKNPKTNYLENIFSSSRFFCQDSHCLTTIKGKIITISDYLKYFTEDCSNVDIIIINQIAPYRCPTAIVFDKKYLQNHRATIVYIDKIISITSAN
ncbi:ComEC/Rec2 family competence protein [Candidatus Hepatincolaceae symbiont of Richtersius coronifer]